MRKSQKVGLMIVLIIFFTLPLSFCDELPCPFYTKPLKDNCAGCGLCQGIQSKQRNVCFFDKLNYFHEGITCNPVVFCETKENKNKCKGFGCLSMFGTFRCLCDSNTYGKSCEYNRIKGSSTQDYAVLDDIIYNPIAVFSTYTVVTLIFSNIGKNLKVNVNFFFEYHTYNSEACKEVSKIKLCKRWYSEYPALCENNVNIKENIKCALTILIMFSILFSNQADLINIYDDKPVAGQDLGSKRFTKIDVYNDFLGKLENPLFENTYTMISLTLTHTMSGCIPVVNMRNGGYIMDNRFEYAIREEVTITGSYDLPIITKCANADSIKIHWSVWKMVVNHDELSDGPFRQVFGDINLNFSPFYFDIGIYKARLNVSVWKGLTVGFSFKSMYFEMIELNPLPVISGGEERSIYYDTESLTLDGRLSRELNVIPSKQGSSLKFYWKCDKLIDICKERHSDYSINYSGPFQENEIYTFYLRVISTKNEQLEATTSQKIRMLPHQYSSAEILCKKNCGGDEYESNPGIVIYLESTEQGVDWTYTTVREDNYKSVDGIRQNNTPDNVLIILEHTLSENETYLFQVTKGQNGTLDGTKYKIKMASKVPSFSCNPDISFGNNTILRGVTKFTVVCDRLKYNILAPIYDFYDRHVDDKDDNGRLILSGQSNIAFDVVLTRGRLVIVVTDEYGMTNTLQVNVTLKENNNTIEFIPGLLKDLRQNDISMASDVISKTNTISVIYDLMTSVKYTSTDLIDIAEYMLRVCADNEIDDIPVLKMVSNLLNTIASGNLKTNLSMNSVNYLSKSVIKLSEKLLYEIKENVKLTVISKLTLTEIYRLCKQLLKACDSIYESSAADLAKKILNQEDEQDYYASYRDSSDSMVRSVRNIMSCISMITLPYEWPTKIEEGRIHIWLKEDNPEAFSKSGKHQYHEPVPSVEVPEILAKSASKVSKFVIIQVAHFDDNPYFYNQHLNVYTNAVDLRVLYKDKRNVLRIIDISHPVVINLQNLGTEKKIINGSVYQPDFNKPLDIADMQVAVHQLRVPLKGRMIVKFLDLQDGQIIKVLVLFNKRPDYEFMRLNKNVTNITKLSSNLMLDLKYPPTLDMYDLYYIGILPGSNHMIGQYINYSFEISTVHCVSWNFHEWSTRDCSIKEATVSYNLQCECKVFSTVAGVSPIPLHKFDPFDDYKLVLNQTNNLFVQILLGLLLLIFLLLLVLALWKDYSNVEGKVIYLEDNFPGDKFSYLVAVFTGSKFFGGTTSNVGIMIEGDKSCSRPHMLRSSWCRTLTKGEDDWFLLSTVSHLGNLKMIHLWMDYSGSRPEWYCYKIIIIDMLSHNQYLFLVDAWLSLRGHHFVERYVKVTKNENDKRFYIVVDNLIFGLRDTHLWLGVWFGHSRSIVSRAQRLATAFNELLIIMLVSCLFLFVLDQRHEDYAYYNLPVHLTFIMVVSIIFSTSLVNIIISIFRKTFLFKEIIKKENEQKEEIRLISKHKHKSTNCLFRCCEGSLKVLAILKKFKPVTLHFDKKGIPRKRSKYSLCCLKIGWTLSLAMIMICFIVMFYCSMSMSKVKTLVWLTCIAISLLLILFLVAPLKLLVLAALSGLFYYNINQVVSYHIRMNLLHKYKRSLISSEHHLISKLISMRRHSCYLPLTYKKLMKKFHKQRKFDASLLLLDMFLIGILIVLFFIQNESLWTTKYYWNNKQLKSLLRHGYKEEGAQLYSLKNLSHYSLFLEKNVFPVVYQTRWYNKEPIVDGSSTSDERFVFSGTSKLFGLPRLRQIRLKPDLCEKPIYENLSQYCNTKLNEDTEDTSTYAEGWVETGPHEKFSKLSPWNYMSDTQTYDTTLFGYSNIAYKGDGYVAELDRTAEKAEDIILMLHREKWLDRRTCVVVFELTLYNAFSGTFSWLISVTENLHIGMLMNRVYVFTVGDSYEYPIIDLVFFGSLLMFAVRVFFVVNRNGIDDLANDFWNVVELIMVCLGVICTVLFILNINSKHDYLKTYMKGDIRDKYFEYLHLLRYLDSFRLILSVLAIMLVCRFMKSWRFGQTFYILFKTLSFSWIAIAILFFIVFLASFLYFEFVSYLINDFMTSKHNFPVMSKTDFKQIVMSCNTVSCKISPLVLCFTSLLVQLLIVLLFLASFRIVKRKNIEIAPMNFFTVFFERFKKYLLQFKHESKKRLSIKC